MISRPCSMTSSEHPCNLGILESLGNAAKEQVPSAGNHPTPNGVISDTRGLRQGDLRSGRGDPPNRLGRDRAGIGNSPDVDRSLDSVPFLLRQITELTVEET